MKILALLVSTLILTSSVLGETVFERIDKFYRSGAISYDEMVLYKTYALFAPEKLPLEFQGKYDPAGCGTPVALEIRRCISNVSPEIAELIRPYLVRPSLDQEYNSPGGHFKIHFTYTGTDAVPNFEYVQRFANYFDIAWKVEIDTIGYFAPPSDGSAGGDSRYDVYIVHIGSRTYGVTQTESLIPDTAWQMCTSYILVRNEYEGFYSPEDGAMRTTAAHEFHHAIIFGYNYTTPNWWQEACCVNMEDRVATDVNDCYQYLRSFYENPELSIMVQNGSHEYGSFVFPKYLQENFGDAILRETLFRCATTNNPINALDIALSGRSTSFNDQFSRFESWNYVTGSRDDRRHFREAGNYTEVYLIGNHISYPVSSTSSLYPPQPIAANFIRFSNDYSGGVLRLYFDGDDAANWRVKVVKKLGGIYFDSDFPLGAGYSGTLEITDWSRYPELALIPVNLSRTGSTANFVYSATLSGTAYLPPRNLRATFWQPNNIPLNWDPPQSGIPSGYNIYRSDTSGGTYSLIGTSSSTSYIDSTVINGRIYYYVVSANYSGNESGYSNQAAGIAGAGSGALDTLIVDNGTGGIYFGGSSGIRLANIFVPSSLPVRIIGLQFNLYNTGQFGAEIRKVEGSTITDIVWQGSANASTPGWITVPVSDEVIIFGSPSFIPDSSFAVAFKPSTDEQRLWASNNNSGLSFYWGGSAWVSFPGTFMIRAIVEFTTYLGIQETSRVPDDFSVSISPNPFNSGFSIRIAGKMGLTGENAKAELYDICGHRISWVWQGKLDYVLNLRPNLSSSGVYLLKLSTGKGVYWKKIVYLR